MAKLQFHQGATVAPDDTSYLSFTTGGGVITVTDTTPGPAPSSRTWSIISWPSPLASRPILSSTTATTTTFPVAASDGMYAIQLLRIDNGVATVQQLVAGVEHTSGKVLPSFGIPGRMLKVGASSINRTRAMAAGWAGSAYASTHKLLDAILRAALAGGGGGGASIANGGGTLALDGSGNLTTTGTAAAAIETTGNAQVNAGGLLELFSGATGTAIESTGGIGLRVPSTESIVERVGDSLRTVTVSGANRSEVRTDAAGSTACTDLYDNVACSRTVVGSNTLTCNSGTMEVSAGGMSIAGFSASYGAATANVFGAGGAVVKGTAYAELWSPGGPAYLYGTSQRLGDQGGNEKIWIPMLASVTPVSGSATSIGSLTFPTNSSGNFDGHINARNGATNAKHWQCTFAWVTDGSTVSIRDFVATADTTTLGTIGATVADGTPSGLGVPIEATSASGIRMQLTGAIHID